MNIEAHLIEDMSLDWAEPVKSDDQLEFEAELNRMESEFMKIPLYLRKDPAFIDELVNMDVLHPEFKK